MGVGSELPRRLREYLGERGVNGIYLLTHRGTPAERLCARHGCTENDGAVVMTLEWNDSPASATGGKA